MHQWTNIDLEINLDLKLQKILDVTSSLTDTQEQAGGSYTAKQGPKLLCSEHKQNRFVQQKILYVWLNILYVYITNLHVLPKYLLKATYNQIIWHT